MIRIKLAVSVLATFVASGFFTGIASAHWKPGAHNAIHAIKRHFGKDWRAATNVAYCEASAYHWLITKRPWTAENGQYEGMFQMGEWERETYGHGPSPWHQSKAAVKYFRASGSDWSPWECKPWTNPMPSHLLIGF